MTNDGEGGELDRLLLSRLTEGVVIVNERRVIEFANQAFLNLFQLSPDVLGQDLAEVSSEPSMSELADISFHSKTAQTRGISIPRDGATRYFSVSATPWHEPGRGLEGAILVFHDITEIEQVIRSDFVANVSHELRTPVSILAGFIENLADDPTMPRKEQAEIFGIMENHAARLKALLDDLLTLSCLESRREVLDYVDLDLRKFFRELAHDWQRTLSEKSMAIALELADDVPLLRVDRFRFEQVIHNLFDNSFKYSQIEGQIRVRAAVVDGHVEISVEDNGSGIPEGDLPHIFERFYRVDKGRSRKYGGTGLGLSIVKHIIALHGGSVRAESTLGMTTRIIISLPIRRDDLRVVPK